MDAVRCENEEQLKGLLDSGRALIKINDVKGGVDLEKSFYEMSDFLSVCIEYANSNNAIVDFAGDDKDLAVYFYEYDEDVETEGGGDYANSGNAPLAEVLLNVYAEIDNDDAYFVVQEPLYNSIR